MERADQLKLLRTTKVLMINNWRSLSPRLALNEEGKEKPNVTRVSAPKLGKRPGKNTRRMTQFSGKACRNCRNRETELQACSSPWKKIKLSNFNL